MEYDNSGAPYTLAAPMRMMVAGRSGAGKTTAFIKCVLDDPRCPQRVIIWVSNAWSAQQPSVSEARERFNERAAQAGRDYGWVDIPAEGKDIDVEKITAVIEACFELDLPNLVVFDDLVMASKKTRQFIQELFVNGRHKGASVAELRQQIFGGEVRMIRLNCTHLLLCDFGQMDEVANLLRQVSSDKEEAQKVLALYRNAIGDHGGHGFLLICRLMSRPWKYRRSGLGTLYRNVG
jgi:hypothetical protein